MKCYGNSVSFQKEPLLLECYDGGLLLNNTHRGSDNWLVTAELNEDFCRREVVQAYFTTEIYFIQNYKL